MLHGVRYWTTCRYQCGESDSGLHVSVSTAITCDTHSDQRLQGLQHREEYKWNQGRSFFYEHKKSVCGRGRPVATEGNLSGGETAAAPRPRAGNLSLERDRAGCGRRASSRNCNIKAADLTPAFFLPPSPSSRRRWSRRRCRSRDAASGGFGAYAAAAAACQLKRQLPLAVARTDSATTVAAIDAAQATTTNANVKYES